MLLIALLIVVVALVIYWLVAPAAPASPPPSEGESPSRRAMPEPPRLYNFIMAEQFIQDLRNPRLSFKAKRKILNEICYGQGMIKRAQQEELRFLLNKFRDTVYERGIVSQNDFILTMVAECAVQKIEQVTVID